MAAPSEVGGTGGATDGHQPWQSALAGAEMDAVARERPPQYTAGEGEGGGARSPASSPPAGGRKAETPASAVVASMEEARAGLPDVSTLAASLAGPGGSLSAGAEALVGLRQALEAFEAVDWHDEDPSVVRAGALVLDQVEEVVGFQQLQALAAVDRRELFRADGAVTAASWYRHRSGRDHHDARRRVEAAVRLRDFPQLEAALAAGRVCREHVTAITTAAVPARQDALASVEGPLVDLALRSSPRAVRTAVSRVRDIVDRDGVDEPPEPIVDDGPDPRRGLSLSRGFDGLWRVVGDLDQLTAELLATLLDAFEVPDPPEVAFAQRRSPGQRRHDALQRLCELAASHPDAGRAHGHTPRTTLTVDLLDLFGLTHRGGAVEQDALAEALQQLLTEAELDLTQLLTDLASPAADSPFEDAADTPADPAGTAADARLGAAAGAAGAAGTADPPGHRGDGDRAAAGGPPSRAPRAPRLRFTGALPRNRARALALVSQLTVVLTCGPWRPVSVGRSMRTAPAWMRAAMFAFQPHCRGPDCDRPATWTQAHHTIEWAAGGATDLDHSVPLCQNHHDMVSSDGWHVHLDPTTAICTWTSPDRDIFITHPPL